MYLDGFRYHHGSIVMHFAIKVPPFFNGKSVDTLNVVDEVINTVDSIRLAWDR